MLIANPLGAGADRIFALPAHELTTPPHGSALVCYTLQIYFDFGGYSDMAIGLGRMFGFRFRENFNQPYSPQHHRVLAALAHVAVALAARLPLCSARRQSSAVRSAPTST